MISFQLTREIFIRLENNYRFMSFFSYNASFFKKCLLLDAAKLYFFNLASWSRVWSSDLSNRMRYAHLLIRI